MTPDPAPDGGVFESDTGFEPVSLESGDPAWVFPAVGGAEAEAVRRALDEADAHVRALGVHVGVSASVRYECQRLTDVTLASVQGVLELPGGVIFLAALYFPRRCGFDLRWGPPWVVDADITRYCPAPADCAGHPVADSSSEHDTPLAAARAFADITRWLRDRAFTRTRPEWLSATPTPACPPFPPPSAPAAG
ncbi:hypothetical protein ACIRL2_17905 [Embleya sp. NPDC127516]|uniref:hypothetical protein n=1 Tax=Embleya sp. NPDC127516 TaxID=3363990 RepID=UPI0038179483